MRTSSAGKASSTRGVTLIEMMVVVMIVAIMAGISYPAVASGIDSLRLNAACRNVVAFLNAGLNRAEARQLAVEISFDKAANVMRLRSPEPGFERTLALPEGISMEKILPEPDGPVRSFMLYPGGSTPRIGVLLENRRKVQRLVEVDPMTGVPRVSAPPVPES